MKGKSHFTQEEIDKISALIALKVKSTPEEQKKIRKQIRALGFYASDFGIGQGYSVAGFNSVINGKVQSQDQFSELIKKYKVHLRSNKLKDEIYKWNLLGQFNGRPNPDAKDFYDEIKSIKFLNLIYPMGIAVAHHIAKERPEEYRECFRELYNEQTPLVQRLNAFTTKTLELYRSVQTNEKAPNHHHDERTMATFLTYRHPELYAFYKDSFYQKYCKLLGVKSKGKGEKYVHYLDLLGQFREDYVANDEELLGMVDKLIPQEAYRDPTFTLLAQDILYTVLDKAEEEIELGDSRVYKISMGSFGGADLEECLKDQILLVHRDTGGKGKSATTQAADFQSGMKIGDYFYLTHGNNPNGMKLLGRITGDAAPVGREIAGNAGWLQRKFETILTSINTTQYKGPNKWWTPNNNSTCIEISSDELEDANKLIFGPYFHARLVPPEGTVTQAEESYVEYKQHPMGPPLNLILYGPPGTGKTYKLVKEYFPLFTSSSPEVSDDQYRTELVSKYTWWEVISAAVLDLGKTRVTNVLNHGLVQTKSSLSDAKNVRALIWGNLQAHTKRECTNVNTAIRIEPLFFDKDADSNWSIDRAIVEAEAPEVTELLAAWKKPASRPKDELKRYEFVTFHQSFSYEDFVEGIKPKIEGTIDEGEIQYEVKEGIFKSLCARAKRDPNNSYALFIDEINRGNVSQIFGELITLIEEDKREGKLSMEVELPYSRKKFSVPGNLHVIGTMNTADRSVEALDTALRRRFCFEELQPKPEKIATDGESKASKGIVEGISLVELLEIINLRIEKLLDKDHLIGHSYFMSVRDLTGLKAVFQNNINPLLQEYFFGDPAKIEPVLGRAFFEDIDADADGDVFADSDYDVSGYTARKIHRLKNVVKMEDDEFIKAVKALLKRK